MIGTKLNQNNITINNLTEISKKIRKNIIKMTHTAGSGHPGGALSSVEILTTLYFKIMNHKPIDPKWTERDKFILSKAHACPVLYATLAEAGYFPESELKTFRQINSRIQGHSHIKTPGVEMSGGSLGQGLSFGVGTAIASKLDNLKSNTYVLLGDGECDEGQIWEAAMSASHHKLNNLIAIVDRNKIQNDRFTDEVMSLEPFEDKWKSFGWNTSKINGHSFAELIDSFNLAKNQSENPTVLIADTVKGKGVSFMENNPAFHGKSPDDKELLLALKEIDDA
tara:strand:+ start:41093 stop:41935 length:843 start_codon:yes stop_codon:yes gene_type:complete